MIEIVDWGRYEVLCDGCGKVIGEITTDEAMEKVDSVKPDVCSMCFELY